MLRLMTMLSKSPLVLAALIGVVGCGSSSKATSAAAGREVATVDEAAGPQVSCGGGEAAFPVGLLSGPATDLATGDQADRALLAELKDAQTFGAGEDPLPVTGWFRVVSRDDYASWVRSEDRRTVLASVDFAHEAGDWRYLSSFPAGCPLRLVESGVEFARVGSADVRGAAVELRADGGSCGGAGPTLDRVEVAETAATVTVVVRLRPEPAREESTGQSSPIQPPLECAGVGVVVPVPVELKQPLGSRILLDGSEVPAVEINTSGMG